MSLINMIAEEVQRHKEFNERRMRERLENDRYEAEMMAPIVQALEEYVATGPTYINPVGKEAPVRYEPIYSEYDPELIIGVRIHAILAEITVFGDQFRVDIT